MVLLVDLTYSLPDVVVKPHLCPIICSNQRRMSPIRTSARLPRNKGVPKADHAPFYLPSFVLRPQAKIPRHQETVVESMRVRRTLEACVLGHVS